MSGRKTFGHNDNLILFQEVGGVCPLDGKPLMYEKQGKQYKKYEIAHIYPLNPTAKEIELLKDQEKLSTDVNDKKNLMALCLDCHTKLDKPRTVAEYQELVRIKKNLLSKEKNKLTSFDHKIEAEVQEIIDRLSSEDFQPQPDNSNYSPVTIDSKTDGTISAITKTKIKNHVRDYFFHVQAMLAHLEAENPETAILIGLQIRQYYHTLKKEKLSQQEIFSHIVDWVHNKTKLAHKDACEVFVSFFVQNCEVFE